MNQIAKKEEATFRGYWAIKEVIVKLTPLVARLNEIGKHQAPIALRPADFDVIVRWPKAAEIHGLKVSRDGGVTYQSHAITRHVGKGRYE